MYVTIRQILKLQSKVNHLQNHLAAMEQQSQVPFPGQHTMPMPGSFPISNVPAASNIEANVDIDLSCLFDEEKDLVLYQQQNALSIATVAFEKIPPLFFLC
jgi:hypothetical protein